MLAAFGTKFVGRMMTILYGSAFAGGILTIIIIGVTSHGGFVSHLNAFSHPFTHSPDTYGSTIAAGKKAGDNPWGEGATTLEWTLPSPPPYHQFETLPKID